MIENEYLNEKQASFICQSDLKFEALDFTWEIKSFSKVDHTGISSGYFPKDRETNKWSLSINPKYIDFGEETLEITLYYDKVIPNDAVEFQCSILDFNKKVFDTCKKSIYYYI